MARAKKKEAEAPSSEEKPEAEETAVEFEPVEMLGRDESRQAVYAMLFASDRPLSVGRIAEALGDIDPEIVANLLAELRESIEEHPLPYVLREIAGGYQLTTKPEFGPFVRRLFQIKRSKEGTLHFR